MVGFLKKVTHKLLLAELLHDLKFCGEKVYIDEDVWIGANVTILKGVHIGEGSIVAAGAVVTNSIGRYEVWGGIPARKIKDRFAQ